jgi:hypothetical protein
VCQQIVVTKGAISLHGGDAAHDYSMSEIELLLPRLKLTRACIAKQWHVSGLLVHHSEHATIHATAVTAVYLLK